jgi:hypothetical protein
MDNEKLKQEYEEFFAKGKQITKCPTKYGFSPTVKDYLYPTERNEIWDYLDTGIGEPLSVKGRQTTFVVGARKTHREALEIIGKTDSSKIEIW